MTKQPSLNGINGATPKRPPKRPPCSMRPKPKLNPEAQKKLPEAEPPQRDPTTGRFLKGWKGGPGNPLGKAVQARRVALLNAVTEQDVHDVARRLVELAKGGDRASIQLLFERVLGKPTEADLIERLEMLEAKLSELA